jgi:GTP-binding protein EngB required for normal cell division
LQQRTESQNDESPRDRLAALIHVAGEAGAPDIAADAVALAERLAEGRFYVAFVGQFKRGKSTLINALIGQPVLPVGVIPITTAVTVVRFGDDRHARVCVDDCWREISVDDIAAYVSEEGNPGNEKGVSLLEVFASHPLLASGMCLVDTPGIGSVIAANTNTTRAFVPHIDAAVVVLGADPPISGEELNLIEEVSRTVPELIMVLNKADRSTEQERRDATAFARKVLAQRLGRLVGRVFEASATEQLATRQPTRDWEDLKRALAALADTSGAQLVRRAERRGCALLVDRLLHEIDEQRDALVRPISESEARIHLLRTCVTQAERALNDLGYLLSAEQERLQRAFDAQCQTFLASAIPAAREELAVALQGLVGHREPMRRRALQLAQDLALRRVDQWLAEAAPAAETLYRSAAGRFSVLATEFLDRLANSEEALATLPRTVHLDLGFRMASRLYYTELFRLTGRSPLRWLVDFLLPSAVARRRIVREADERMERLLRTNAMRVKNDLNERVLESRRRLERELREYLRTVCASADRALERARARWQAGQAAVQAELGRLQTLRDRVEALGVGDGDADRR